MNDTIAVTRRVALLIAMTAALAACGAAAPANATAWP
jgi:hypothetical protein